MSTFAERFKLARMRAGLSQETAAELVGVSRHTIIKWESGRSEPPLEPALTQKEALDLLSPRRRG